MCLLASSGNSSDTDDNEMIESKQKTRKIKVFHLITSLEVGGAQNGLLLGLPRFDNDRYEHVLCSVMAEMQMADLFTDAGVQVMSLGLKSKYDLMVAYRLRAALKNFRPDILHTYLLHANVLGRIVGRLSGVDTIIGSERTVGLTKGMRRVATMLTNPLTDAVEVNAKTVGASAMEDLGVPAEKIEVVRSGFDFSSYAGLSRRNELRSELGIGDDVHLVLSAARFRPSKGVEYAIRAFAAANEERPKSHLVIAGEGEQFDYLVKLSQNLGASESITFLGRRNDIPDLLAASDSMLLASLNEGLPRISIEAMAAGKPVIATDVGGTSEVVINNETGILVQPKDIEAVTSGIIGLIDSAELCTRLGETGRRHVQHNYSVDNYVARLDSLYRQLLGVNDPQRLESQPAQVEEVES